ncbi:neurofilament medium polypeptide isoform X1 [Anguilla anguilla]|uniref:neurofilament medium polypeptide isoform X1 n=2 Tax=Anguilla anguilla TaxID=7936 RepID=UPI0015ADC538|nr:neurofilament medium polypeptide isoform X1 [Anguilla anguilla]XP_035249281.1 neurofilament medium polypeptide isoform X1 [Anguilla anguilla]XP_035249282.1 neurofilament medium polypeptide isoform X1 [Anguilla anguilla]XP_035249284.1 neurofilament medium polypeptide isoform X1 [Anguilla anguilla]XP_035249285.1 neurofilament medium polypeptide isoform X1 [Anguilla anguilla]XP_035249286.1 neurofilament medium polypeptide isoform X1 [Anguilla anguilla]
MDMEEYNSVGNMDSLLFQLVLQTQDLSRSKDEIEKQVEISKLNIAEKKTTIEETKRTVEKLEETMTQKENLVKYYKNNAKSLKVTNNLLIQYEKTLQLELERKQEVFSHDAKMYQERTENYRKVFEQHKARYYENPLVQKLVKAQTEKEEIERRIRACEGQIVAKENELQTLQGNIPDPPFTERASESTTAQPPAEPSDGAEPQAEESAQIETGMSSLLLDPQQNASLVDEPGNGSGERQEAANRNEKQDDEMSMEECAAPSPPADKDAWLNKEDGGQLPGPSQQQMNETEAQGESLEVLGVVEAEQREVDEAVQKPVLCGQEEKQGGGGFPQTPPARMSAVPTTPIFSLHASPGQSPGQRKPPESPSPTFLFSMSTTPETAVFSGFDCSFDLGSPKEEDMPFTFTSSYFENRKSSDSKSPGFLIDQMESQAEEEFELFFSTKSPNQTSAGPEQGEANEFSFFNFGKD